MSGMGRPRDLGGLEGVVLGVDFVGVIGVVPLVLGVCFRVFEKDGSLEVEFCLL